MRLFFTAFRFLTIVPLPGGGACRDGDFGRSMRWFPLVGLLLGGALLGLDQLLSRVFPDMLTDLLLVSVLLAVTGGLHLDGVADVFDGLAARGTRERMLEVMKDPRCGAAGAASVVLLLLFKYVALMHLPAEARSGGLLLFPLLGRFAQVQITVGSRRARGEGLGALFIRGAGWKELGIATVTALAACWFCLSYVGLYLFCGAYLITFLVKLWFHRRLGGITGDVIGFACETVEAATLLLIVALLPPEAEDAAQELLDV
ncbi:MAG TPA: adenosylcobinamide-GDP ribazoletransferase [Verrucomicrobiae bacterium]|nr:adenosylcobinamide-GDP ribazoletransferase [Verrucomicrobiae bacterium]